PAPAGGASVARGAGVAVVARRAVGDGRGQATRLRVAAGGGARPEVGAADRGADARAGDAALGPGAGVGVGTVGVGAAAARTARVRAAAGGIVAGVDGAIVAVVTARRRSRHAR